MNANQGRPDSDPGNNNSPRAYLIPNTWRRLLAKAFADAEDHGLGVWTPAWVSHAALVDEAADFIAKRCDFYADELVSDIVPDDAAGAA